MAQIGLKRFKYSPIGKNGKYTGPKIMEGAIEAKASLTIAEAELYGDDQLKESVKEFSKGTLSLVTTDDPDSTFAPILGHEVLDDGEVLKSATDTPPYCGFGRIVTKMVNGVRKYRAEFFTKVQFKPFVVDGKTKGENIEFTTPSVEGTIYSEEVTVGEETKNLWERHKEFTTYEDADTYLDTLMAEVV